MLTRVMERRSLTDPSDAVVNAFTGSRRRTSSSVPVSTNNALEWTALSAGVRRISSIAAMLPLPVFERQDDGGKEPKRSHPVFNAINRAANPEMTALEYREMLIAHIILFGVSYTEIVTDRRGRVRELWPINPDRVRIKRDVGDDLVFKVRLPRRFNRNGRALEVDFTSDQMLRIPGFATGGLIGESLVDLHKETIGLGLATERFAAKFFGQGAAPSGVLETDKSLSDKAYERLREDADTIYSGLDQQHRLALLEEGLKWKQITTDPERSQLVEARRLDDRKAAQILNIQPHLIGDMSDATFSNIEMQSLEFVMYTMLPWLRRIESRITMQLFGEGEENLFAEHVVEGLLRGDSQARAEFYQARMQTGSITPNEIRALENDNPVPGGDMPFIPLNMIPLQQAKGLSIDQRARLLAAEAEPVEMERRQTIPGSPGEASLVAARKRLIRAFSPMLQDKAEQLIRGEVRNVSELLKQVPADNLERLLNELERFYRNDHPAFVRSVMRPVFRSLTQAVASESADRVDTSIDEERVQSFADEYTDKFAVRESASSRRQLQDVARKSRNEDRTAPEAIEQRLEEWEGRGESDIVPRPAKVATEEVHRLSNASARFAFAAGGVTALIWRNVGTENCPLCQSLEGKVVDIQGTFLGEGDEINIEGDEPSTLKTRTDIGHPPLHQGCDCMILPAR